MNLKINKKIRAGVISLAIMLGLILNVAVFTKVDTGYAQACADGEECTGVDKSEPKKEEPKKTGTTKKTTSPSKSSGSAAEKAKQKYEEAQKASKEASAQYDKQIAEKQKQLESEKDPAKQAKLKQEIEYLKGYKEKDPQVVKTSKALKAAESNYNKEKTSLETKAKAAQQKYYKSNEKKVETEKALSTTQKELKEAEAAMATVNPNSPEGQKLQEKIATLKKQETAQKKELETITAATQKAEEEMKALQTAAVKVADQKTSSTTETKKEENLSEPTVPFPYVASPSTSHSFNVDKYLTVSNEHGAYFEDSQHSSAVNFIIRMINILVRIIGSVAMLIMIIGGVILITAHGNEQQLEKGKDTIKYGLIGLVLALSASLIIAFVNYFLSVGSS